MREYDIIIVKESLKKENEKNKPPEDHLNNLQKTMSNRGTKSVEITADGCMVHYGLKYALMGQLNEKAKEGWRPIWQSYEEVGGLQKVISLLIERDSANIEFPNFMKENLEMCERMVQISDLTANAIIRDIESLGNLTQKLNPKEYLADIIILALEALYRDTKAYTLLQNYLPRD